MTEEPKCDFCSQRPVVWRYPARSVRIAAFAHNPDTGEPEVVGAANSPDDWAACAPCHDLIEACDYTALLDRSVEHFPNQTAKRVLDGAHLRYALSTAHKAFRVASKGAPVRFEP